MREIIGSYSGDIAGAMGDSIIDNYDVCANNNDDTGDVLNNDRRSNEFLNTNNKMKIDLGCQEMFHNLVSLTLDITSFIMAHIPK